MCHNAQRVHVWLVVIGLMFDLLRRNKEDALSLKLVGKHLLKCVVSKFNMLSIVQDILRLDVE